MSDEFYDDYKSKSAVKREYQDIRSLAVELTELSAKELDQISISPGLRRAFIETTKMKKAALQRQLKFVTGMLAEEDLETVKRELFVLRQPRQADNAEFHHLEELRDQLAGGDDTPVKAMLDQLDSPERQQLRQLLRNSRKAGDDAQKAKTGRALFRFLRDHNLK